MKIFAVAACAFALAALPLERANAASCESLTNDYGKFDNAAVYFDRASKSETSTLRASTAQSALTNILVRQGIILDMLIALSCDMPEPPDFIFLGLISSNN